jgi:hypothetical protein
LAKRLYTLDEIETALMSLKPGKAAGFDGIYPEFNFILLVRHPTVQCQEILSFLESSVRQNNEQHYNELFIMLGIAWPY